MTGSALLLFNPAAGPRRAAPVERLRSELEHRGLRVEVHSTRSAGDATGHLRERPDGFDLVVAAGGDGTVSEVVNGLESWTRPRLGVFPVGTTNVLARELSLPRAPDLAAESFVSGRPTPVRPGRVGDRRFLLWVGAGFDAAVVGAVDLDLKRRIGRLAYLLAAARQLPAHGSTAFQVRVDDRTMTGASVLVTRVKRYAGPFHLTEEAGLADPDLRILVIRSGRRSALLRHAFGLLFLRLDRGPGIASLRGSRVELTSAPPSRVQVDGDPGPMLPLRLGVEERQLLLMTPGGA